MLGNICSDIIRRIQTGGGAEMPKFEVVSEYTPSGDQPEAIEALSNGDRKSVV